jgi:hypothetical protein
VPSHVDDDVAVFWCPVESDRMVPAIAVGATAIAVNRTDAAKSAYRIVTSISVSRMSSGRRTSVRPRGLLDRPPT